MRQSISTPYPISDILQWDYSGQLEIAPRFQRRDVWSVKAKSYLIDTILREMPIPPVFIRLRIDPIQKRTLREVVDGQQRIRAVLGFVKNEFSVMKVHNKDFAGMYYTDLPSDVQKRFLGYMFTVHLLDNVGDADVLAIFARLNTYTVKLNAQELRNAEFFGAFKQTIYDLSLRYYSFWRNNKILTDPQITRMREAELVSTLVVTVLDGIRQTKSADLREFYLRYDDEFPKQDQISERFSEVIDTVGNIFDGTLASSRFRRIPLFFSLFIAIYDARFGLPNSNRPRISFTQRQCSMIHQRLRELEKPLTLREPPDEYLPFVRASQRSTADIGSRRIRHKFIWEYVLLPVTQGR